MSMSAEQWLRQRGQAVTPANVRRVSDLLAANQVATEATSDTNTQEARMGAADTVDRILGQFMSRSDGATADAGSRTPSRNQQPANTGATQPVQTTPTASTPSSSPAAGPSTSAPLADGGADPSMIGSVPTPSPVSAPLEDGGFDPIAAAIAAGAAIALGGGGGARMSTPTMPQPMPPSQPITVPTQQPAPQGVQVMPGVRGPVGQISSPQQQQSVALPPMSRASMAAPNPAANTPVVNQTIQALIDRAMLPNTPQRGAGGRMGPSIRTQSARPGAVSAPAGGGGGKRLGAGGVMPPRSPFDTFDPLGVVQQVWR